jgi:hypothetical protein
MKKSIIFILLLLAISASALSTATAIKPVKEVPPLPSPVQLEYYEDSEELFTYKVMEYYEIAVALRSQIESLGMTPKIKFNSPSLEELGDQEVALIVKYYNISRRLYKEIDAIQGKNILDFMEDAKDKQQENIDTIISLAKKNFRYMSDCEREKEILIQELEEKFNGDCRDFTTVASGEFGGNILFTNGINYLSNKPHLSGRLNINPYKVLRFWQGLDLWIEYQDLKLTTQYPNDFKKHWSSFLAAVGARGNLFTDLVANGNDYHDGLKLGLGYFWSSGNIYNDGSSNFDWEGMKLEIEYFVGSHGCNQPLEVFIRFGLYSSLGDELILTEGIRTLDAGRTITGISLGLRYNFWKSPF